MKEVLLSGPAMIEGGPRAVLRRPADGWIRVEDEEVGRLKAVDKIADVRDIVMPFDDDLDDATVKELRKFAEDEFVDVSPKAKKAELIDTIRQYRAENLEDGLADKTADELIEVAGNEAIALESDASKARAITAIRNGRKADECDGYSKLDLDALLKIAAEADHVTEIADTEDRASIVAKLRAVESLQG